MTAGAKIFMKESLVVTPKAAKLVGDVPKQTEVVVRAEAVREDEDHRDKNSTPDSKRGLEGGLVNVEYDETSNDNAVMATAFDRDNGQFDEIEKATRTARIMMM